MRRFAVTLGDENRTVQTPEPRHRAQRRPPLVGTIVLPLGYEGTVASLRRGGESGSPLPDPASSADDGCCG